MVVLGTWEQGEQEFKVSLRYTAGSSPELLETLPQTQQQQYKKK